MTAEMCAIPVRLMFLGVPRRRIAYAVGICALFGLGVALSGLADANSPSTQEPAWVGQAGRPEHTGEQVKKTIIAVSIAVVALLSGCGIHRPQCPSLPSCVDFSR